MRRLRCSAEISPTTFETFWLHLSNISNTDTESFRFHSSTEAMPGMLYQQPSGCKSLQGLHTEFFGGFPHGFSFSPTSDSAPLVLQGLHASQQPNRVKMLSVWESSRREWDFTPRAPSRAADPVSWCFTASSRSAVPCSS